jgi:hypothetical protein
VEGINPPLTCVWICMLTEARRKVSDTPRKLAMNVPHLVPAVWPKMTGPSQGAESQIAPRVNQILKLFRAIIETFEDASPQRSTATSHLARFKLWAGSLGAHRPSGSRSLEYRLRDASFIRDHILSLLSDLCSSLEEGALE